MLACVAEDHGPCRGLGMLTIDHVGSPVLPDRVCWDLWVPRCQCHRELPGYPFNSMPVSYLLKEASAFYVCALKNMERPLPCDAYPIQSGSFHQLLPTPRWDTEQNTSPGSDLLPLLFSLFLRASCQCWESFVFFLLIWQKLPLHHSFYFPCGFMIFLLAMTIR